MPENPPGTKKPDPDNPKKDDSCYDPEITEAILAEYRLPKSKAIPQLVRVAIIAVNAEARRTEKLHKQLREISNESIARFMPQFISWIINLLESERPAWLRWINNNTDPKKRKSQVFREFMEQVKKQFSLTTPDLEVLIALFTKYNIKRNYNREIQAALQKYLDERDLDNENPQPKPKIK